MRTVRFEEGWERAPGASSRTIPRLLAAAVALAVVFGCFFAIGHTRLGVSVPRAELIAAPPVTPPSPVIPTRLSSAPPLGGGPAVVPQPAAAAQPATATAQPAVAVAPVAAPSAARLVTPAPPAPAPSPPPAPAGSTSAPSPRPSSQPKGGGGSGSPPATSAAPSRGGSFDSSG
jgi:hypothetical protein